MTPENRKLTKFRTFSLTLATKHFIRDSLFLAGIADRCGPRGAHAHSTRMANSAGHTGICLTR
jgi:hypothetical protein